MQWFELDQIYIAHAVSLVRKFTLAGIEMDTKIKISLGMHDSNLW